jgi:hypothetical protein
LADHELCQSQIHVDAGFDVCDHQQGEIEMPRPSFIVSDFEVDSAFPSTTFGGTIPTSSVAPLEGEPVLWPFNLFPTRKDGFSTSLHLPQSTDRNSYRTRRHGISLDRTISNFSPRPPTNKSPATQTTLLSSMSQPLGDPRPWIAEKAGAGAHHDGSHPAISYDDPGSLYSSEYRSMFSTVDDWS